METAIKRVALPGQRRSQGRVHDPPARPARATARGFTGALEGR